MARAEVAARAKARREVKDFIVEVVLRSCGDFWGLVVLLEDEMV